MMAVPHIGFILAAYALTAVAMIRHGGDDRVGWA